MIKLSKSQSIMVYATLIAAIALALIAMAPYIQRRIQGIYKAAGDAFGDEEQR